MRTGVLSDSNAKHFQPMDFVSHERHLGLPHIEKTAHKTRKRKQGYRSTPRPRAPYIAHFELAQLMNPENPKKSIEAFSTHMETSQRPIHLHLSSKWSKLLNVITRVMFRDTEIKCF